MFAKSPGISNRPAVFTALALMLISLVSAAPAWAAKLSLTPVGTYTTGIFDEGAAEIVVFDPASQNLYISNANANSVDIVNIATPSSPSKTASIDLSPYGGGVNSVAVKNGVVAVAVEADPRQDPGKIVFFTTAGTYTGEAAVGALPDMVTFSPDGTKVVTACEGEPNDDYTNDPEGTVCVIDISAGVSSPAVSCVDFSILNPYKADLISKGIRIFGPNATVAQDLEPEYIAIEETLGRFAYVTLQENNAIAVVDINTATLFDIWPLGTKDHSLAGNTLDASNKDNAVNLQNWPVKGFYMPDAIASFQFQGMPLLVTANEGDSRDYDGYSEEERVKDLTLDASIFTNAADLQKDENLGRLKITTALADTNENGEYKTLYAYGARSFAIWGPGGSRIWDSGDEFEKILQSLYPDDFNSTNDENGSFDDRSDDKGCEPEGVTTGVIGSATYAFIGLERMGGVMAYDITNPFDPEFAAYVNNRDFSVSDATSAAAGDLAPEGLTFIQAAQSPSAKDLLVVTNEVSGSTTIYEVAATQYPATAAATPLTLTTQNGVAVHNGGFGSGMAKHPVMSDHVYLMTDRGPNISGEDQNGNSVKIFPVPDFTPQIGLFKITGSGLEKVSVITIKDPGGNPISGLPNPAGMGSTGETAKDLSGNTLGTDDYGLDSEGLVAADDGTFWVSDEYGPHIVHLDAGGKEIERINPFGSGTGGRTLPKVFEKRRANRGMEGLCMTPSGKLVGIMQSAMYNPDSSVKKTSNVTRLVEFDPDTGATKQYLYLQEEAGLSNSEIRAFTDTIFVVLERDGGFPGDTAQYKRFYVIDTANATDVSDPANSENGLMVGTKTLEQCTETELAAAGITPVAKTLGYDLLAYYSGYPHDKPEGFAIADNRYLMVINDDDFAVIDDGNSGLADKTLPLTGNKDKNILYIIDLLNP